MTTAHLDVIDRHFRHPRAVRFLTGRRSRNCVISMLSAVKSRMADAVARIDRYQEAARNGRSVAQVNAAMAVRSLVWVAIAVAACRALACAPRARGRQAT